MGRSNAPSKILIYPGMALGFAALVAALVYLAGHPRLEAQLPPAPVMDSPDPAPSGNRAPGPDDLLTDPEENPLECDKDIEHPSKTFTVTADQVYKFVIDNGSNGTFEMPFELASGQRLILRQAGALSPMEVASCKTQGRNILCEEIFVATDSHSPPRLCTDLKLSNGSTKKAKIVIDVKVGHGPKLPDIIPKVDLKSAGHPKGIVTAATDLKIWESGSAQAKLVAEVPYRFYFPPSQTSQMSYQYFDKVGDRFLTDMIFGSDLVWVSGLEGTTLDDYIQSSVCPVLSDVSFCTEPKQGTCQILSEDPDRADADAEDYLESISSTKRTLVESEGKLWLVFPSTRKTTRLPKVYLDFEAFQNLLDTSCD